MPKKASKIRVDFRKNRGNVARRNDVTRDVQKSDLDEDRLSAPQRMSGKGHLSRRRTVLASVGADDQLVRDIDESQCVRGRVISAIGATRCQVQLDGGQMLMCTVRRVVQTLARSARNAVVTGDEVLLTPHGTDAGVIERVEPRRGVLAREHQGQQHVLVANVSQVLIVASLESPPLKPNLIDRFLVSAEKGQARAVIAMTKADLVDTAEVQPIVGRYSELGYRTVLTSLQTGMGLDQLRAWLINERTVVAGQSGVGKSSLLNSIQPGLALKTGEVSAWTQKGKHTTRVARLMPLAEGGWVVDTPGIRQLELWNVPPGEVEAYFPEFRPLVAHCRFPNCLHLQEEGCAVQAAVQSGLVALPRYESYLRMVYRDDD